MLTQTTPPALAAEIATLILGLMMLLWPAPTPEFATVAIRVQLGDPSMKRLFACGHKGQGKFCHRCSNEEKAVLAAQDAAEQRDAQKAASAAPPRRRKERPEKDPRELERLRALKLAADRAEIDLSAAESLPAVMERALHVLSELKAGAHPQSLGGKKLATRRGYFSVPVGLCHRIFVEATSLRPTQFVTHETYNRFV